MTIERDNLELAIEAYVSAQQDGAYLRDWILVTAGTTPADFGTSRTYYGIYQPVSQPPHVTMGLLSYASAEGYALDDDDD